MRQPLYEFGPFRVDPVERVLLREGQPVSLTPKVFDLLLLLLESNGHVVEKKRLMLEIWPGTFVEDGNLTQNISVLRKSLREGLDGHEYIQTVARRGYRFVGGVHEILDGGSDLIIEEHSRSRVVIEEAGPKIASIHSSPAIATAGIARSAGWKTWTRRTLGWPTLVAVSLLTVLTGYFVLSHKPNVSSAGTGIRSVAVLPFQSLSTSSDDEFLALGMADALTSRLSNVKQVSVRPTSAVRKYAAKDRDAAAAGRELGVDSVLEGSIQRDGERIRVIVQLVDVKDSRALWAHTFDEKFTDIFTVEDAISENVRQALELKLTQDEMARLGKHYTQNPEAYALYLEGRFYLNKFTADGTKLARKYFQQALEKDPKYAQAYAGLADSYAFGEVGLPSNEALPLAKEAATKALELAEPLAEAHAALAQVRFLYEWDWSGADQEFRRAIELNPNQPEVHHMYAHYLMAMNRTADALVESQRFLELDPLSPTPVQHLGWHYNYARQYDQAIEQYKKVLAIDPNYVEAHRQLADAYGGKGLLDQSVEEMQKQQVLLGRSPEAVAALGNAYRVSGWKGYWLKRLELAKERAKHEYVSPSGIAGIYMRLRDKERALEWLEKAYQEHDLGLVYLRVEDSVDFLRGEQRFQDLLARMRL